MRQQQWVAQCRQSKHSQMILQGAPFILSFSTQLVDSRAPMWKITQQGVLLLLCMHLAYSSKNCKMQIDCLLIDHGPTPAPNRLPQYLQPELLSIVRHIVLIFSPSIHLTGQDLLSAVAWYHVAPIHIPPQFICLYNYCRVCPLKLTQFQVSAWVNCYVQSVNVQLVDRSATLCLCKHMPP